MEKTVLSQFVLPAALFLAFTVWYFRFHLKRKRLYELAAQYGGPRSLPFIGNVFDLLVPPTDIYQKIISSCSGSKSPSRLWIGPHLSVQIWDPENVKIVLNSPHSLAKQPFLYRIFEFPGGRGLLTLPVTEWKRHRKLIAPVFNQKHFEDFFKIFDGHSKKLVASLRFRVDEGIFDGHAHFMKYGLDTVIDAILDFTGNSDNLVNTDIISEWYSCMYEAIGKRIVTVWYYPEFIFKMSDIGKRLTRVKVNFDQFINTIVEKWKQDSIKKLSESNGLNGMTNKPASFTTMKLMDHLLSQSNGNRKLTHKELHEEITTIISAGMETMASTVAFILVILGAYPDIQVKVFEEITHVLGTKKQLEYEDLKNLQYLERVIKETLRFRPGLPGIARYNDQEIQLTNHVIPAHTSILIPIIALHQDPTVWPNPIKFDPDRFLPEEEAKRHPYSWIPFSAGPRNCIGIRYAYISLKIVVATFLLHYKVTSDYKNIEDIHFTMMTILKPTHGYRMSIAHR